MVKQLILRNNHFYYLQWIPSMNKSNQTDRNPGSMQRLSVLSCLPDGTLITFSSNPGVLFVTGIKKPTISDGGLHFSSLQLPFRF